jgi:ferritin-like metal-binding protein YciE
MEKRGGLRIEDSSPTRIFLRVICHKPEFKKGNNFMKINTLQDLYVEELRDIYNAETQLIKALPKVAHAATSDELRSAVEDHLEQTKVHIDRLDQIFQNLGEAAKGRKCKAMEGLIAEAGDLMNADIGKHVLDAAIIASAQRVEHYEISVYGTLATFAKLLGREEDADLLFQSLDEEKEADEMLTDIAESTINVEAKESEEMEEAQTSAWKKAKGK